MTPGRSPKNIPERIQRLLDERGMEKGRPDPASVVGLWIKAVNSDLDAREAVLSTDNRVGLAYQAGLQAVRAFLDASGYRVRSGRNHHYYSFYAAQALAEAANDEALRRGAEDMDGHRARRATAVYDAEPATENDLADLLGILDGLLPAIRAVLLRQLPRRAADIPPAGQRPGSPGGGTSTTTPRRR